MPHVHLMYDLEEIKCMAGMTCKITTTTPRVL